MCVRYDLDCVTTSENDCLVRDSRVPGNGKLKWLKWKCSDCNITIRAPEQPDCPVCHAPMTQVLRRPVRAWHVFIHFF